MKIKWLGHACFYLEIDNQRIVMDPFIQDIGYPLPELEADIVTISHNHSDHSNHQIIKGNPQILNTYEKFTVDNLNIYGVSVFHDLLQGKQRGNNLIFIIEDENFRIAHLGDLGHPLSTEVINILKGIDILLIPTGSVYTIGPEVASLITKEVQAKITIPMHYKTDYLKFNLEPVNNYLSYFNPKKVKHLNTSEIVITSRETRDMESEIWVLSI